MPHTKRIKHSAPYLVVTVPYLVVTTICTLFTGAKCFILKELNIQPRT